MMPVFLLGAVAGELTSALGLAGTGIGLLVALYYGVSAVSSLTAGRVVESLGWPGALVASGLLALAGSLVIAASPATLLWLVIGLVLTGAGNGIAHPAANAAIVEGIRPKRRGFAFGFKQAAVPGSALLSGLALPLIAVRYGWQAPFFVVAAIAGVVVVCAFVQVSTVRSAKTVATRDRANLDGRHLWALGAGVGLATAACNTLGAFIVLHALNTGLSPAAAGLLLTAGSLSAVLVRLASGWAADRRTGGHLQRVTVMMVVGAGALVLVAWSPTSSVMTVGTMLAFGVGWGWVGLFQHGTMALYPDAAARVTGLMQASMFIASIGGPILFGATVDRWSFALAWILASSWLALGAALIWLFRTLYRCGRYSGPSESSRSDLECSDPRPDGGRPRCDH